VKKQSKAKQPPKGGFNIAVTGLNATDNPAPGVGVIKSIRANKDFCGKIIGLVYDALEPGIYAPGIADEVYSIPYPSEGDKIIERLAAIQPRAAINALIPTLDAEIPNFISLQPQLRKLGIATFLPGKEQFDLRAKTRLAEFGAQCGVNVPRTIVINESSQFYRFKDKLSFPIIVKGVFYEAYYAGNPDEAVAYFNKLRTKWGLPVVAQEYITGEEYDVVAVGDGKGNLLGAVPMRKMFLTDKGKAWAGVTINDRHILKLTAAIVRKLKWRGPLEIEILKRPGRGEYYLLEINPRFPAWVYLAAGCGQNLPYCVAELALGRRPKPFNKYDVGTLFVRFSSDIICPISYLDSISTQGELIKHE
jgi:carbamoyl-phosphate synthase large subunit